MNRNWLSPFFLLAAVYDGLLGLAFLASYERLYAWMGIPLPNHPGYVQFPAALLLVFAVGFLLVAKDPVANRSVILLGILLKLSYTGVVLGHWLLGSIPGVWTAFAWADIAFGAGFLVAWRQVMPTRGSMA